MSENENADPQEITVTAASREWGYHINITDRNTGEQERRWIDDRNERVNLERDNQTIVETNVAEGATLTLNGDRNRSDVVMARVHADTATTVNINTGGDNDVIAPTTRNAEGPREAGAARPQFNINGGQGDDTVVLGSVPADRVIIERTGEQSYRVTDGTGTDINLTDVEYIRGREQDRPVLSQQTRYGGAALPEDRRGVELEQLDMPIGSSIRLSDAQQPLVDERVLAYGKEWDRRHGPNAEPPPVEVTEAEQRNLERRDQTTPLTPEQRAQQQVDQTILNGFYNMSISDYGQEPTREGQFIPQADLANVRSQLESTRSDSPSR